MDLNELFELAEQDESAAVAAIAADPAVARAHERAGDYQRGEAAPALVHAAHRGMARLVAAFLDAGAHLDARGMDGGTALHIAAWSGSSETVAVLLERGADVHALCTEYEGTPLLWAAHGFSPDGCFPKRDQLGAAQLLLDAGSDPRVPNRRGNAAVDLVAEPPDNPMLVLLRDHARVAE